MTLLDPTYPFEQLATIDMAKQQQQQQQPARQGAWLERPGFLVEVMYRVKDEQRRYLPKRRHPGPLPAGTPLPSVGDIVYFDQVHSWAVQYRVHVWEEPGAHLRIYLWLDHFSGPISERPSAFGSLQ